jgi:uncharacterized protein YcbK (DUF882 family)
MNVILLLVGLGVSNAALHDQRELSLYHTHTGKSISVVYYEDGTYVPAALQDIDDFLKDFRNGARHDIDPALLDVLYEIKVKTGSKAPFEVISAYRSPETNQMLRAQTGGVAQSSMHIQGQAIDVRLRDVSLAKVRDVALRLQRGGVGFYPESEFVHVDTGRVRHW